MQTLKSELCIDPAIPLLVIALITVPADGIYKNNVRLYISDTNYIFSKCEKKCPGRKSNQRPFFGLKCQRSAY